MSINWADVPLPDRMKNLPKDRRGMPIPANILIDKEGNPHFTINDDEIRQFHIKNELCSICGQKLLRGRWSVGGPGSALHPNGAFIDPPMHYECCRYAMQVCPYLAAPSYNKRIDARTLKKENLPDHSLLVDNTVIENRPDPFVMVMHIGQSYTYMYADLVHTIKPKRPHKRYEFWSRGIQLPDDVGMDMALRYIEKMNFQS